MKKAVIFGSTGLTGSALLNLLLTNNQYDWIICFVRKDNHSENNKLSYVTTDFSSMDSYENMFENADVYCCLGTTIKQVGYDKEKFKSADLYTPLQIAEAAKRFNSNQFLIISAMGANSKSSVFYNRVKGELHDKLLSIDSPALHVFQPSLLLGNRKEKRTGEKIGTILSAILNPIMIGGLKKYRGIHVATVAKAMANIASQNIPGNHFYTSDKIQELGNA